LTSLMPLIPFGKLRVAVTKSKLPKCKSPSSDVSRLLF
jgi:hypothetical protein